MTDLIPREVLEEMARHVGQFPSAEIHLVYREGHLLFAGYSASWRRERSEAGRKRDAQASLRRDAVPR